MESTSRGIHGLYTELMNLAMLDVWRDTSADALLALSLVVAERVG